MQEKAIRRYRILVSRNDAAIHQCSVLVNWQMDISSGERWRTEERVSILLEPELSSENFCTFVQLKDIQEVQSILHCKTIMYCYQKVSPSIFITVGNGKELRSTVNHGLTPGAVSLKTSRQAVFFTVVHPMVNQDGLGETLCDLSQARIAPYKNTWKRFQKTVCWCILKLAQQRGLQFSQTRPNAVILHDTLPAEFIQKAICMKTKDQLYQKESVILRPRVVLKANSQSGSQDLLVQEARSSWESEQDVESCGETRSSTADCRVLGISISTVKLQDAQRQNNVTRNNEMFEKQQHKDHFLEDMSEKQEINKFSEESQQLLEDMNQTEISELLQEFCKTSLSWSTSGVRQQPRKLIATLLQSLALSLRRIPVEDQSTAHLKDRSCSSRPKRCLRKRDNQSPAAIQRFSQGGVWGPSAFKRRIQCLAFCNRSAPVAEKSCLSRVMRWQNMTFFSPILCSANESRYPFCAYLFDSNQNLSM